MNLSEAGAIPHTTPTFKLAGQSFRTGSSNAGFSSAILSSSSSLSSECHSCTCPVLHERTYAAPMSCLSSPSQRRHPSTAGRSHILHLVGPFARKSELLPCRPRRFPFCITGGEAPDTSVLSTVGQTSCMLGWTFTHGIATA